MKIETLIASIAVILALAFEKFYGAIFDADTLTFLALDIVVKTTLLVGSVMAFRAYWLRQVKRRTK